jgi:hypothetical protein
MTKVGTNKFQSVLVYFCFVKKFLFYLIFLFIYYESKAQYGFEKMVELTGVVMSSDSLRYLPYVTIAIPSKNRGTTTTEKGLFSLIVEKGDTLVFSSLGFRKKEFVVPKNLSDYRYSIIQLMTQDTFFLANTIIRPSVSKDEFDNAFKSMEIPDDKYEIARKNTEFQTMRMLLATLPRDGGESQTAYQNIMVSRGYWAGQQPPQTIFSPLAWMQFFKAWKRGDFRKKY